MGKKNRILFLRSNPVDPDPRVEKSAASLAKAGYRVSILGWNRTGNSAGSEQKGSVGIVRLEIKAGYGTGIRNLPALLRWEWGCLVWLIRNRDEFDILHACDFDTVLPALFMKLFWGKTVIYDIFDFYADHLRSTPSWIKKTVSFLDKKAIGWVDGVILVDECRREQIAGSRPKRVAVIYNTPQDINFDIEHEISDDQDFQFTLTYVGLLQEERGLFEVLEILQKHPDWTLELAGFGGDEVPIREIASGMENVHWYGRISYEHALELSRKADVLFATYDPAIKNHQYASPNKVFEAMMLGKPIVAARDTNIDHIIEHFDCGIVINYGNVGEIEKALTTLCQDEKLCSRLGENARSAYESTFNWSIMESRLSDLYASIQK